MLQLPLTIGFFVILTLAIFWLGAFVWQCLGAWLQMQAAGAQASLAEVIKLKFQSLPLRLITDAYISLIQQGEDVSLEDVKAELLFGGEDIEDANDLVKAVLRSRQRAKDAISP